MENHAEPHSLTWLFGWPVIAITIIFASCSTAETVQEHEGEIVEAEVVTEDKVSPAWFDPNISSSIDSTGFYGFSLAAASSESRATGLSIETAFENLRFEIDRFAEDVRKHTEEGTGLTHYNSGEFIMNLRNAIQNMSIEDASVETEYTTSGSNTGTYYVYTRVSLPREDVISRLSGIMNDEAFVKELSESE